MVPTSKIYKNYQVIKPNQSTNQRTMAFKVSFTTKTKKITIYPHWLILEICIAVPLIIIGVLVLIGYGLFATLLFAINKMIDTVQYLIPSGINVSDREQNK